MKKNGSTVMLLLVFILGLGILLYPMISNYVNSKNQSVAVAGYDASLADYAPEDFSLWFSAADDYNSRIRLTDRVLYAPELVEGYYETLDVSGTGIMGYITIDKIKVELPIYHGTGEAILQVAVGHIEGTSLPVGGESTHCALSAHRGLPNAKLFSDLDELEPGDCFTVTVLNRVLTYQVEQILIVEPQEIEYLQIVEGEDYCTLLTCTPYGINTHRMLVRGTRVETPEAQKRIYVPNDGYIVDPVIVTPLIAIPMLLVLLVWVMVKYRKRK